MGWHSIAVSISSRNSDSKQLVIVLRGFATCVSFLAFASSPALADKQPVVSQAHDDYLIALNLADEGSKPEALHFLAESLRLQPEKNPAAAIAFQILGEQRTNSSFELRGHTDGVITAAYSPDGTKIITGSKDHTARIWDARTGLQLVPPLQLPDDVGTVAFNPKGTAVATGCEDGTAQIWDVATGKPIGVAMKETDAIKALDFSPDGKLLATGSDSNYARLWDATTGNIVLTIPRYHDTVFTFNFSPDGTKAVTATGDGRADVFDVHTGKLLVGPLKHRNNIMMATFSSDGKRILTGSSDNTAQLWDATTGKPIGEPMHQGYWMFTARFNADSTRVVTASWDHTARVWDVPSGKPVTPPLQHGDAVYNAVFSPDGTMVATASRDHTARVWDATTGEPLTLPLRADTEATSVVFNKAGNSLLVTSGDTIVRSWDIAPRETPPPWLADLADFGYTQVRYDANRQPKLDEIMALRTRLLASTSNDPWEKFGRWYFMESDVRPVAPWSTMSLQEYVDNLTKLGDLDSINYALVLSQDRPAWVLKLLPLRAKLTTATANTSAQPAKNDDAPQAVTPPK
jgi:WD40 repeat protein